MSTGAGYPVQGAGYPVQGAYAPSSITYQYPSAVVVVPEEETEEEKDPFAEKIVRHRFIRKVYAVLTVQLLITLGIIAMFMYIEDLRLWATTFGALIVMAISAFVVFLLLVVLTWVREIRRNAPWNFILLGLFTLAFALMFGILCSYLTASSIYLSVGVTAAIVFGLTIFAFQTKFDITGWGPYLFVVLIVFFCFGIIKLIFINIQLLHIVYHVIGVLIWSTYLVYDTQRMMIGKKSYTLSPEDYVYAALQLYIDIIEIFYHLLRLFGSRR